ncbi:hypothetical protein AGMMS49921_05040 [Endomicrobiia bacterium]|nr:hypothetical protein AGMMS49921_05040 [Endomicrobiia bacterium]
MTPTFSSKYYEVKNALDEDTDNAYCDAITNAESPEDVGHHRSRLRQALRRRRSPPRQCHHNFVADTDDAEQGFVAPVVDDVMWVAWWWDDYWQD